MSSYAIGDVQGCLDPLKRLLDVIRFDPACDTLWFAGDLVNRGPDSLETLRFIHALGTRHRMVLGNHDLHLLALAEGVRERSSDDTLEKVLQAPDRDSLLDWLAQQPLMQQDEAAGIVMTHAGLPPYWDIPMAASLAAEVAAALRGHLRQGYLQHLYGNQPNQWDPSLTGWERLRFITNALTRMRFCLPDGRLVLTTKKISGAVPWFQLPLSLPADTTLLFGHWAALSGKTGMPKVVALDTGCVWGFSLTAWRFEDQQRFTVPARV